VHQPRADAETARRGIDVEEAKLGRFVVLMDEEDRADHGSAALGDPAILLTRLEVQNEVGADSGNQSLIADVPAILLGVEHRLAMDDPAHVADAMRADHHSLALLPGRYERLLDLRHGSGQPAPTILA